KHLTHRENKQSTQINWEEDRVFPLLGQPWHLTLASSGNIQMTPGEPPIKEYNPITLTSHQTEKFVMAWYNRQAITYFNERAEPYAHKLGVPLPPIKLSRAKTRWGSCNSRGVIHLNWRLIQMPSHLVNYVVAHELSHLIEMNHSPEFWRLVGSIYPDYLGARKELKQFGC
ncbi:MAG: M48 family metallopeptidase, partial [Nitrosomonas sp.]|nr:M48 family metallopeptidase [Nitrosomonas sp.]